MNLVNLEQFKQQDDSTGFYEFKFEWDERVVQNDLMKLNFLNLKVVQVIFNGNKENHHLMLKTKRYKYGT